MCIIGSNTIVVVTIIIRNNIVILIITSIMIIRIAPHNKSRQATHNRFVRCARGCSRIAVMVVVAGMVMVMAVIIMSLLATIDIATWRPSASASKR